MPVGLYIVLKLLMAPGTYVCEGLIVLVACTPHMGLSGHTSAVCLACGAIKLIALRMMTKGALAGQLEVLCMELFCLEIVKEETQARITSTQVPAKENLSSDNDIATHAPTPLFCLGRNMLAKFSNQAAERLLIRCGATSVGVLCEETTVLATSMTLESYLSSLWGVGVFPVEPISQECVIKNGCAGQNRLYATVSISRYVGQGMLVSLWMEKTMNDSQELADSRTRLCLLAGFAKDIVKASHAASEKVGELEHAYHGGFVGRRVLVSLRKTHETALLKAENIHDFSRILEGECVLDKSVFNFSTFLQEFKDQSIATCGKEAGARLSIFTSRDLPQQLFADRPRLLRLLLTLLTAQLQSSYRGTATVRLAYRALAQEVEFEVADPQTTLSPHRLNELRHALNPDPHYDASENLDPTSLDLFTVSHIVSQMGSQVVLDSDETSGTRFCFRIRQPKKPPSQRPVVCLAESRRLRACSSGLSTFGREALAAKEEGELGEECMKEDVQINLPRLSREWRNIGGIESTVTEMSSTCVRSKEKQSGAETKQRVRCMSVTAVNETGRHRNVLVVDDSSVNRLVMRGLLEKLGMDVKEADNGLAGSKLAAEERFACVFMDIEMPIMDGLVATRRIRDFEAKHTLKPVPIIAVTALDAATVVGKCYATGMNEVLLRPISLSILADCVRRHLH